MKFVESGNSTPTKAAATETKVQSITPPSMPKEKTPEKQRVVGLSNGDVAELKTLARSLLTGDMVKEKLVITPALFDLGHSEEIGPSFFSPNTSSLPTFSTPGSGSAGLAGSSSSVFGSPAGSTQKSDSGFKFSLFSPEQTTPAKVETPEEAEYQDDDYEDEEEDCMFECNCHLYLKLDANSKDGKFLVFKGNWLVGFYGIWICQAVTVY